MRMQTWNARCSTFVTEFAHKTPEEIVVLWRAKTSEMFKQWYEATENGPILDKLVQLRALMEWYATYCSI